ncbi:MAG: hypothetical protein Q8N77_01005 [Nanoarchaeota archaeon]|nr:hypothetical protein [Nanoarchaeota archaeon]
MKKNLAKLVEEIDPALKFERVLGRGGYGIVLKVTDGKKHYRLKINHRKDAPDNPDNLEMEYSILSNASKTNAVPKAVRFYDNAPSTQEDLKGKNAYLTEFIEGKPLLQTRSLSELSVSAGLVDLIVRIHEAGYKLGNANDFNAENILVGEDGVFYLLDPRYVVPLKGDLPFRLSREESIRVNELARRYG